MTQEDLRLRIGNCCAEIGATSPLKSCGDAATGTYPSHASMQDARNGEITKTLRTRSEEFTFGCVQVVLGVLEGLTTG